jgi:Protein kinase domain
MTADDQMLDQLGPYRLLEQIGEGGMGVVFKAEDPAGQLVALKVLRSVVAGEPTARYRLAREVETMRRVRSPYVAEVIDADLAGDTPYIVTRYVPGRTLDQVVTEGGPLPAPALARLACGLANALAAVHAAGVVHRDLKPSNVMLLGELPVVIDFGIAQGPDATRLTMTGMFMGTPGYLAPEVIEGQPSSEASDIHAWGGTVAFAATGRAPYGTGDYEAIFYRIVHGQPDLAGVLPSMLPLLTAALAREPGRRPPAALLSTQAAALDPSAFALGAAAAAAGPDYSPAVPATSTGLAGGAGLAADQAGPAAVPTALDGLAAASPGPARPGTQPLQARRLSPADFADVLPPVRYQPGGAGPRPGRRPGTPPPEQPFGARGPRAGRATGARWPTAMVIATMVIAAGLSVVLPVVAAPTAMALIILLRAGNLAGDRRRARGTGPGDRLLLAALSPWYLVKSLAVCLLLAPFALAAAVVAGGIAFVAVPSHQLPRAVAVAAGALVAFYGFGPWSARPRRQLSRLYGAVASSRIAQAVALAGMTALALATLAAAASWPSLYWPAGAPGGVWHFGMAHPGLVGPLGQLGPAAPVHHLALLGRLFLLRLRGG